MGSQPHAGDDASPPRRTLEEAVARLQGRYADDIAAYAAVHADILAMADMLSDGIIEQFPNRFGH